MTMSKSVLNVGGQNKTVVVINHKEGTKQTAQQKSVDQLHHIHILDRSGSMYGEIEGLIENVKQTIDAMADGDYVSIVWFASEGQYKTLIKGAKKDNDQKKLLDTIKSTLGCTCFSDPIREVGEIINELKAICPNFNITLFTDGEPVVTWGEDEEEKRVFKEIAKFKDDIIAFNTVGYGYHYNRDFLVNIAAQSQYGMMIHSSKINEYMSIFSHNYERIAELVMESVEISAKNAQVLYLNSKSTKLNNDYMKMSMLEKKKNQFFVIADNDNDFDFEYNGEKFNSANITDSIKPATIENFLYAYAYELYYNGRRQEALDILAKTLKDKFFVDNQINAFTYDEVSAYSKKLRRAVFKNGKGNKRWLDGKCPADYIPADDALCIMDVLQVLANGDNYYVYNNNYNRIGRKTEDTFNLFQWAKEEHKTKISELIFSEEELNISIRSKINGTVKLNPVQAKAVGLPDEMKSFIYRNQTLIKDGNLNIESITVIADSDTSKTLLEWHQKLNNTFIDSTEDVTIDNKDYYKVVLNLTLIPIINRTYLNNGKIENVAKAITKINELEVQQKVVNYYLKQTAANAPIKEGQFVNYTDEQVEVLKQHGLAKDLCYSGVNNKVAEKNEDDYYLTRKLLFALKGFSTLPSVKDVLDKVQNSKKLNGPAQLMSDYINVLTNQLNSNLATNIPVKDYLEKELRRIKSQLFTERIQLNSMKIATVLTGAWFDNLVADGKGNYNYEDGINTLVVKTAKVKKYF